MLNKYYPEGPNCSRIGEYLRTKLCFRPELPSHTSGISQGGPFSNQKRDGSIATWKENHHSAMESMELQASSTKRSPESMCGGWKNGRKQPPGAWIPFGGIKMCIGSHPFWGGGVPYVDISTLGMVAKN